MKTLRTLLLGCALALAFATTPARGQESPFKFEFHGFVTGSLYYEQQVFVNAQGQGLLLAAPSPNGAAAGNAAGQAKADESSLGGDIRQARFSFSVTGPSALGGIPRGYLELDLFGGVGAGGGAAYSQNSSFGLEQNLPRIRVAIAELKMGNFTFQAGQQNQLVVPQIPDSLSHIANPIPYGAGLLGWRTPGVRFVYTMPMEGMKLELAGEVVRNRWGADLGAAQTNATISPGEASSLPMLQARVKIDGKSGDITYMGYVVGVYHWVDLNGVNNSLAVPAAFGTKHEFTGYAVEGGGKLVFAMAPMSFTIAGNVYTGQATGNMLGTIAQYGDIQDLGFWVQAGFNATKEFSIWGLYGSCLPSASDIRKYVGLTNRMENAVYGGQLKYAEAGYALALEGYQYSTTYGTGGTAAAPLPTKSNTALQVIGSAAYHF